MILSEIELICSYPRLIKLNTKLALSQRLLFLLLLCACTSCTSADANQAVQRAAKTEYQQGVDQRMQELLSSQTFFIGDGTSDPDAGKRDWPPLLAEMYKVRADTTQLLEYIHKQGRQLVFSPWAGNFCKPFTMPGLTMYYFTYKALLPEEQKQEIYDTFYTKKKDCHGKEGLGWEYLKREDHLMDPIYGETEFNSENFNWMARFAGYLFAHEYQDSVQMAYFDPYIRNWIRTLYHVGRLEWNSNTYWGHCFNPLLVLYQYAPEAEVKQMARAGLDWMMLEAALHYLDGFQAAGDVRAKANAYQAFAGSVWGYSYIFFATDGHRPSYYTPTFDFGDKDLKEYIGYLPYIDYYPPPVVVDIARRKVALPVEIRSAKPFYAVDHDNYNHWRGDEKSRRFEFETIYMDENLLMVSLASNRPDGNFKHQRPGERAQRPFSEESLWRLAVKGDSRGAYQLFGNSGEHSTMAGRCPFEEIAQYKNMMIRAVKGTDNTWLAVPNQFVPVVSNHVLFFDLGKGVYAACVPINAQDLQINSYSDSTYTRYRWTLNADELGGTILQTASQKNFGTFEAFQRSFLEKGRWNVSENRRIDFLSTGNDRLSLVFRPPTTYRAYTGEVIDPAGVTPEAWANGQPIAYDTWEVYQTVNGQAIVSQEWGGGILKLQSNEHAKTIRVDPHTAQVSVTEH